MGQSIKINRENKKAYFVMNKNSELLSIYSYVMEISNNVSTNEMLNFWL